MNNPKLKYLEDVPWDNSLKLSNGKVVHGLEQLPIIIRFSDDEVFYTHIIGEKNDFVDWIRDIIGDNELAEKVAIAHDKDEFLKIVDQGIIDIKNYKEPEQPVLVSTPISVVTSRPVIDSVPVMASVPATQSVIAPQPATPQKIVASLPEVPVQQTVSSVNISAPYQPLASQSAASQPTTSQLAISQENTRIPPSIVSSVEVAVPIVASVETTVPVTPVQNFSSSLVAPSVTPVVSTEVITPAVSVTSSPALPAAVEETFDFEEIFKVLIGELEQDVLTWDTQTS